MNDPAAPPRRWPLVPTLIVAAAILAMIALGVWQLQRKGEKEALIALYERNRTMSATVAYPALPPVPDAMLFRQSSVTCLEPVRWDPRSGTDRSDEHTSELQSLMRSSSAVFFSKKKTQKI